MCVGDSGCYHERPVMVQWKTSSCARLNKEGHESCRGQLSPREHWNSPGKAREIYWKRWNDTFASFLFITWIRLGFYFQVWSRCLPTGGFTWEALEAAIELLTLGVPNASSVGQRGLTASHSPVASQSRAEPLPTERAWLLLKPQPLDSFTPPLHLEKDFTFTETSSLATNLKCPRIPFLCHRSQVPSDTVFV